MHGRATRRLTRVIPNPVVRYAAVTAATVLLPALFAALTKRRTPRR
jgi:hypothetical protein